jgi:hypothetical protein
MANLETYRNLVKNEFDDTSKRAEAVIDQAIKDVYQEIIRYNSKALLAVSEVDTTTSEGTKDYTPLSDYIDVLEVLYKESGDYKELPRVRFERYAENYINRDNGTPECYAVQGRTFRLMPAPKEAGTLKILHTAPPDAITEDNTSIIPDRYEQVLIFGALARAFAYQLVPDADSYQRLYRTALNEMVQEMGAQDEPIRPLLYGRYHRNAFYR